MKQKYKRIDEEHKNLIIKEAIETGNSLQTSKKYSLHYTTVAAWVRDFKSKQKSVKNVSPAPSLSEARIIGPAEAFAIEQNRALKLLTEENKALKQLLKQAWAVSA